MDVKLPCVLRVNDELTLLQYAGRPLRRNVTPSEVSIKAESRILEITESLVSDRPNFDVERAVFLAESVDGVDENNENRFFPNRKFDYIKLSGQEVHTKANYYAAVVKKGKVILFPIKSMFQLRPQLNYMDKRKMNNPEIADSTEDEEEVPVKTIQARISRNQDQKINQQKEKKNFQSRQREIMEEEWRKLNIFNDEPLTSLYGEMQSSVTNPEFCSVEGYLEKLSYQPTKVEVKMERPLREKVLELLWEGQAIAYSTIKEKYSEYSEDEMDSCLLSLCWAINGFFTIKGSIRYRTDIRTANARDRICYSMVRNITEASSQTKKQSVENLATCDSSNKWKLLAPTDGIPSDKSDIIEEMSIRLEQRMLAMKKSRSPSRSPARGSRSPQKTPQISTKSEPNEKPELNFKSELDHVKTEPNEEPEVGTSGESFGINVKTETVDETETGGIFVGPSESEIEEVMKQIGKMLQNKEIPNQKKKETTQEFDLKFKIEEDFKLHSGAVILAFPESLTYCDNELEQCIMESYRSLLAQKNKVKKSEIWSLVQTTEHPISQKYFDTVLRRFCVAQGQSWVLRL